MYLRTESPKAAPATRLYSSDRPLRIQSSGAVGDTATLEISLFGEPALHYRGRAWTLAAPPRTSALLSYLLLNRNVPLEREAIAGALWPDESDVGARANLRRHLFRLQHALPPAPPETPWIVVEGRTIRWNVAANYRLDIENFERFAVEPSERELAIDLYRCDLLERVCEDWADRERDRLRAMLTATLDTLVNERLADGDKLAAARFARTLARVEPYREDALRLSMTLRAELGDRAGALSDYASFAARLRSELAVEPDGETVALFERLRGGESPAPAPKAGGATLSARALDLAQKTRDGKFSVRAMCGAGGPIDAEIARAIDELLAVAGAYVRSPLSVAPAPQAR
jgi:DNA-binding SARP family transcriptional activator